MLPASDQETDAMSAIPDGVHDAMRVLRQHFHANIQSYTQALFDELAGVGALPLLYERKQMATVGAEPALTMRRIHVKWIDHRRELGLRNTANERGQLVNHVLPVLGDMPLHEIRTRHIRELIDQLRKSQLAPRTVRSIYGTMHKFFADLVVDEELPVTPCVLTKDQLPKIRDKNPAWRAGALFTRDEVELLISTRAIPHDRRVINAILLLTGLRFGEFAGLHWRDLDERAQPLMRLAVSHSYDHGTKTESPRLVPVHPVLAEILLEWKRVGFARMTHKTPGPGDLIVPSRRGRMRSRHQHRGKFLDDLHRLGLRHRRVHDTRRTLVTLARVDGARRDVLEQITHAPRGNILDLYTTLPWPTLCEAIACLKVKRLSEADDRFEELR
jgi:integrase